MGKATERLFLPLIRMVMPEVLDINMPAEGVFHNLVIVSIQKRFPGHARKVMHGLWGLGLLTLAKAIVVVDEWVDAQNLSQVAWQVLGNVDWSRDLLLDQGPVDQLDHASYTAPVWRENRRRRNRQAGRRRLPARLARSRPDEPGSERKNRSNLETTWSREQEMSALIETLIRNCLPPAG